MTKKNEEVSSVENVRRHLEQCEKGGIKQTLNNCVYVLKNDPVLGDIIKRNDLTNQIDLLGKVPWERRGSTITDTDFNHICLYMEVNYDLAKDKTIRKAIDIVSSENHYHPIAEILSKMKWDGKERIRKLLPRYLGAEESEYVYEATKLIMLGGISRVFNPGCKFEYMLCVVGSQGAGKSTFFRFLAIDDDWFSDDLRRIEDDNVYRKLQGHWIIEMAEMLATTSAKNIEEIKSFISRQKETYKIPYETHPEDRYRQCIFVGTSNSMSFLPFDRTGNRRFIPVEIDAGKAEYHPLYDEKECRSYIINCWAEAMDIYKKGNYKLTIPESIEKQLKMMQLKFMPEDTARGIIKEWLDNVDDDYVCSRMIYDLALRKEGTDPNAKELKEINSIMNGFCDEWEAVSSHRFKQYGLQRGWVRKNCKQKL